MKIRKYFELNENKSSAFQTLWGAAKVSRVKCIAFKFSLEKMKDLRSVEFSFHLRRLVKKSRLNPK